MISRCTILWAIVLALASAASTLQARDLTSEGSYGGSCPAGTCSGTEANPSVYNFEIGGYPAKIISDGRLLFQPEEVFQEDPELIERALALNFQTTNPVIFELNMLYLEWDKEKILFDVGDGWLYPETAGWLFRQLEVEGIERDSITHIFISHGHFDHIAGLIDGPEATGPAFPNAEIHVAKEELDYFTAADTSIGTTDIGEDSLNFLFDTFNLVFGKVMDNVKPFRNGAPDIIPGISSVPCPYHTPGASAFLITPPSGGHPLLYAGDCIGIESLTINYQYTFRFDVFPDEGALGRVNILEELAANSTLVIPYHHTFPGLGRIVKSGLTFAHKPVNWEFSPFVATQCPDAE